jgi:cobalt-zinc-cadmium efflux system outer membrane protein
MSSWLRWGTCWYLAASSAVAPLAAQALSLDQARAQALRASPELIAARSAVDAAAARERQAGALSNPVLSFAREQTSTGGLTSWQNVALLEQRLDVLGPRGARRDAARLRREAAEARLAAREAELAYEVTRAYANAAAADQRAARAGEVSDAFSRALRVTRERLAGGDISGYASRRIGLEAARYATLRAEAELGRRSARLALATLLGWSADSLSALAVQLGDVSSQPLPPLDSLRARAGSRPELRAALAEIAASTADARAARREAFPGPVAGLGFKNERGAGSEATASGFVLQVAIPMPIWDSRSAAASAFGAEARQLEAESERLRRSIAAEVETAWASLEALRQQIESIGPQLGEAARAAIRAAEAAYLEGEIPLIEWLDAVRAYQEAEAGYASLLANYVIQRAALERAVGARLF